MPLEHFQYKWRDLSIYIVYWSRPNDRMADTVVLIWSHFHSKWNSRTFSDADRIAGFLSDTLVRLDDWDLVAMADPIQLSEKKKH